MATLNEPLRFLLERAGLDVAESRQAMNSDIEVL